MMKTDIKTVESVEENKIKQYVELKEIEITEENTILFDPAKDKLDYDWTDKESALSCIATAYNNAVLGHEEGAIGNLYNAILYLQTHCVKIKDSMGDLI